MAHDVRDRQAPKGYRHHTTNHPHNHHTSIHQHQQHHQPTRQHASRTPVSAPASSFHGAARSRWVTRPTNPLPASVAGINQLHSMGITRAFGRSRAVIGSQHFSMGVGAHFIIARLTQAAHQRHHHQQHHTNDTTTSAATAAILHQTPCSAAATNPPAQRGAQLGGHRTNQPCTAEWYVVGWRDGLSGWCGWCGYCDPITARDLPNARVMPMLWSWFIPATLAGAGLVGPVTHLLRTAP